MSPLIWIGTEFYILEEREYSDMIPVQLQTMLICGWLSIHNSGQWFQPFQFCTAHLFPDYLGFPQYFKW